MTTTPPPESPVETQTLEEIAERITNIPLTGRSWTANQLKRAIVQALRNRDERAVRIIDEHQAMDVCKDNCWTTIKNAIRKGK